MKTFRELTGPLWRPLWGRLDQVRRGHIYASPAPPAPPGPYDILVPAVDGLNGASKDITTTGKQGLIARVIYRNNTAGAVTVTATVDGNPMAAGASFVIPKVGGAGACLFGITGLSSGSHTIAFSVSGASAGLALLCSQQKSKRDSRQRTPGPERA